jgi:creatinine amidohydrolase
MPELAHSTWQDIDALRQETDLAVIPLGAVEVYGLHLPNGADGIVAQALARALAERVPAAVAPLIPVGESKALSEFPGTLWVSAESLKAYVGDVAESLIHWGFRRLLFINSHLGNVVPLGQLALDLQDKHGVVCAQVDVWRFIQPLTEDLWESEAPHGHASEAGTSLLLHLVPELVIRERAVHTPFPDNEFPEFIRYDSYRSKTETGTLGDATLGTAEKGAEAFERAVGRLVEFVTSDAF